MLWKNTSSNGWEYLAVWEDLGLSPMYVICVLFKLVLFLIYVDHVVRYYNNWIIWVSMKYEFGWMVEHWFGICMVVGSSLGEPKLNFIFAVFSFGLKLKG